LVEHLVGVVEHRDVLVGTPEATGGIGFVQGVGGDEAMELEDQLRLERGGLQLADALHREIVVEDHSLV